MIIQTPNLHLKTAINRLILPHAKVHLLKHNVGHNLQSKFPIPLRPLKKPAKVICKNAEHLPIQNPLHNVQL